MRGKMSLRRRRFIRSCSGDREQVRRQEAKDSQANYAARYHNKMQRLRRELFEP